MSSNTPDPSAGDRAVDAIERQAAEWFVLRDAGLSPAQRQEFERWLQADERHAQVYAELDETWSRFDALRESVPTATIGSIADPEPRLARRKFPWPTVTLAAAAALALAAIAWWQSPPAAATFSTVASTDIGVIRKLALPDGSVVQLNTDSAVSVRFTASERRVQLVRGEANFQVAKNPACPFVVSAGRIAVRAVGTVFDVRRRPQAIEVLVTEGKVRVDDVVQGKSLLTPPGSGDTPLLVAGQRAMISVGAETATPAPATVVTVAAAEIGQALAWQERRLEFVATPLAEIVGEFNRYNRHKLTITDPRLAARRFGGTFPVGDYEELVRLLEADFGAVAERGENETRLRLAP